MAIGPLLRWRRDAAPELAGRIAVPVLVSAAALLVARHLRAAASACCRCSAWRSRAGVAAGQPRCRLSARNLRRTPLFIWGMVIAHLGVAVALAGMASDSAFTQEKLVAARPGETRRASAPGWSASTASSRSPGPTGPRSRPSLRASRGGGRVDPQAADAASSPRRRPTTNEAAIDTGWNGQLYAVLGEQDEQGRWQLRLWWKPFVTLIWLGGVLVALGGLLALIGRLRPRAPPADRVEEAFGMSRALRLLPLLIFVVFVGAVAWRSDAAAPTAEIRSQLIGQPVPEFALPPALAGQAGPVVSADLATGQPRLVNIFASWCVPCIAEAPLLDGAASARACRSTASRCATGREDLAALPRRVMATRSRAIGADTDSRVQIALGSAGVPETFVVDGRGIIRHQHIGADRAAATCPRSSPPMEAAR